jgi:hypothetical protein
VIDTAEVTSYRSCLDKEIPWIYRGRVANFLHPVAEWVMFLTVNDRGLHGARRTFLCYI